MTYTVTNTHQKIVITLDTESSATLSLKTYINDSTTAFDTYTLTNGKFTIDLSDYDVGDVITKFEITQTGSPYLWETHEGVKILVNGVVQDDVEISNYTSGNNTYGKFTLNFDKDDSYDVQAVYVGNGSNQMSATSKLSLQVKQPDLDEQGSLDNDGAYLITFVNPTLKSMEYYDFTEIKFRLTKGGVPVPNRVVQKITPTSESSDQTPSTDNKGIFSIVNNKDYWDAGKYKFGATFSDSGKVVASAFRDITIKKGTPTLRDNYEGDNDTGFIIGAKYKVALEYRGSPMGNTKVDMYVNGKKTTKTTTDNGVIVYPFQTKGTFSIKTVYKGDKNHNQVEKLRKITIEG